MFKRTAKPGFGEEGFDYKTPPDADMAPQPTPWLLEIRPQLTAALGQYGQNPGFCAFLRDKIRCGEALRSAVEVELARRRVASP